MRVSIPACEHNLLSSPPCPRPPSLSTCFHWRGHPRNAQLTLRTRNHWISKWQSDSASSVHGCHLDTYLHAKRIDTLTRSRRQACNAHACRQKCKYTSTTRANALIYHRRVSASCSSREPSTRGPMPPCAAARASVLRADPPEIAAARASPQPAAHCRQKSLLATQQVQ